MEHVGVEFSRCGLTISVVHPFLGASRDGIISCSHHGKMLVEVKCPYKCSCQHLQDVFDISVCRGLTLDCKHAYYY